jgi:hypothetical protein
MTAGAAGSAGFAASPRHAAPEAAAAAMMAAIVARRI